MDLKDAQAGKEGSVSRRMPRSQRTVERAIVLINFTHANTQRGSHGGLYPSLFPRETKCFCHVDISTRSST